MSQLMEYAEYLSKEIGPRPAGTEEEQQAALYITERFQKDAGFSAQIEEFTSASNVEGLGAVPGIVVIIVAIIGMIVPMFNIPAFILTAAAAALYTLEAFGHPLVSRALARGASQNVVAKYQPNTDTAQGGRSRSRKIILIARYDSGKVTPGLVRAVESIKLPVSIDLICVGGIILAAFFLLLHIFINAGIPGIIINVLTVICLIICLYPVVRTILYRVAPYNEGANNNASGTAALVEVARRISRGSVSEADLANDPSAQGVVVHGLDAAREADLVPEGAQIRYEAEQLVPPAELGEYDEEERLLAAKAAIAAMTGQPVERRTYGSVASNLVNSRAQGEQPAYESGAELPPNATLEAAEPNGAFETTVPSAGFAQAASSPSFNQVESVQQVEAPVAIEQPAPAETIRPEPPAEAEGFTNAPSWFVSAQQNAKKPETETGPVQRSRYAEAIEAAEREAAEREREREESERARREAELKARELQARAAIEQNASALRPVVEEVQPQEEAQQPVAAPVPDEQAPVFVPYSQAHPEDAVAPQPVNAQPVDDEFAASLGDTMAFDPSQLKEYEEHAAPAGQQAENEPAGLIDLPAVDVPAAEPQAQPVPQTTSPSRSGMFRKLRTDVPSMSGVIRMQAAGQDVSQTFDKQQGRSDYSQREPIQISEPAPVAQQDKAPAPVVRQAPAPTAESVDYDMNPAEIAGYNGYRDDRGYDANPRESSDYNRGAEEYREQPNQVDMPKSRAGGFMSRFSRKNSQGLEETPQEWLDVDEDFDARTVGRERGGWESFREDDRSNPHWEGGSYSRVRLGRVDTRSGEDAEGDVPSEVIEFEEDRQIAGEIEQIYHFRNPLYNTEIWFVALGSEGATHDGTKAFLAEHADDLRGSMLIEVESLGLGELCIASAEGRMRAITASSRAKRYTKSATAATGIAPGSVDLRGSDSASSLLQAAGYQSMHLLGVENGAPALKGSADDILENIDELVLDDNVNFLMELLKK